MNLRLAALLVILLAGPAHAGLAAGVRAFREGRYAPALEEFRKSPGEPEARFYAGAALYKLGRHEEALEALEDAIARDPRLGAGVGFVYLGLARYALRLYQGAREPFERVARDGGGGQLGRLAREHLDAIARLPKADEGALRWYLDQGLARAAALRHRMALGYLGELRRLDAKYQADLVAVHLAASWNGLGLAAEALAALGEARGPGADVQRGRALVAVGRKAEARQAFERARAAGAAPWAEAARVFLETLK